MNLSQNLLCILSAFLIYACNPSQKTGETFEENKKSEGPAIDNDFGDFLNKYTEVTLTTDMSILSNRQKQMIPLLIEAANIMDDIFWYEAYGHKDSLLQTIDDYATQEYVKINYGPWDRLANNQPFITEVGPKPKGANFYPNDMSKDEFEAAQLPDKASLYTLLRRDETGKLITVPYNIAFSEQVNEAASLLRKAAQLADNYQFKTYLNDRAEALLTDEYMISDLSWMDMKDNQIDVIIGPIETYEDQLFGYKAAHEAYVLVKDMEWSKKLDKYAAVLPELQKSLPVPQQYKNETPGSDSQLGAYDVIYYAGDCNAGSKTIAVNLPNDEQVQLQKGTRRLQLKNAMKAKFDQILVPISKQLIDESQRQFITFDAFFANTMFHEVAHGLGIKATINNKGTVREALKDNASALEEGKADILGIFMIKKLHEQGELEGDLKDYYTTFLASIFRSVRFGASSAHGKANMIRFNYFKERGAFTKNPETGTYKVNYDHMSKAIDDLSNLILIIQGDGDYDKAADLLATSGVITQDLQNDLDMLSAMGIPVDIVFKQGVEVLGL